MSVRVTTEADARACADRKTAEYKTRHPGWGDGHWWVEELPLDPEADE